MDPFGPMDLSMPKSLKCSLTPSYIALRNACANALPLDLWEKFHFANEN